MKILLVRLSLVYLTIVLPRETRSSNIFIFIYLVLLTIFSTSTALSLLNF